MTLNIFGVGTDIVKNSRIKKLIKNKKFINRIFTSSEIKDSKKINQKVLFFSKRFFAISLIDFINIIDLHQLWTTLLSLVIWVYL